MKQRAVGVGDLHESCFERAALRLIGVGVQIGVHVPRKAAVGALDVSHVGAGQKAEHLPRARIGVRRAPGRALARSATPVQELSRLEGATPGGGNPVSRRKRLARRSHRHTERHTRVAERLENGKAAHELTPKGCAHDGRRQAKLADENLAVQALRRHCAKERTAEHVLVCRSLVSQDLGQRGAGAIDLDGHDKPARQVDPVAATAVFDQLERSRRSAAMEHAQQIA